MPRRPLPPEVVQATRDRILELATLQLSERGFDAVTMRGLASAAGMTAANLYNYFAHKDEIYLAVQTRGFALLLAEFERIAAGRDEPLGCLQDFARAYVAFGTGRPALYDVMLGRPTPKYTDYVGTEVEPAAAHEKRTALGILELVEQVLGEASAVHGRPLPLPAPVLALKLWATLHGVVSLANARVLPEVLAAPEVLLAAVLSDATAFVEGP